MLYISRIYDEYFQLSARYAKKTVIDIRVHFDNISVTFIARSNKHYSLLNTPK